MRRGLSCSSHTNPSRGGLWDPAVPPGPRRGRLSVQTGSPGHQGVCGVGVKPLFWRGPIRTGTRRQPQQPPGLEKSRRKAPPCPRLLLPPPARTRSRPPAFPNLLHPSVFSPLPATASGAGAAFLTRVGGTGCKVLATRCICKHPHLSPARGSMPEPPLPIAAPQPPPNPSCRAAAAPMAMASLLLLRLVLWCLPNTGSCRAARGKKSSRFSGAWRRSREGNTAQSPPLPLGSYFQKVQLPRSERGTKGTRYLSRDDPLVPKLNENLLQQRGLFCSSLARGRRREKPWLQPGCQHEPWTRGTWQRGRQASPLPGPRAVGVTCSVLSLPHLGSVPMAAAQFWAIFSVCEPLQRTGCPGAGGTAGLPGAPLGGGRGTDAALHRRTAIPNALHGSVTHRQSGAGRGVRPRRAFPAQRCKRS